MNLPEVVQVVSPQLHFRQLHLHQWTVPQAVGMAVLQLIHVRMMIQTGH